MAVSQESVGVLRECMLDRIPVIFSGDAFDVVFQTYVIQVEVDFVALANKVPPQFLGQVLDSKSFGLQSKMLRFISTHLRSDGENMIFPLESMELLEETRQAERFPFQRDEQVVCELLNPLDHKTILTKSVLDMSATGMSVRSPCASELFKPGRRFDTVKVVIDGEPYRNASASVVYTRKLLDIAGKLRVQVGFKFEADK